MKCLILILVTVLNPAFYSIYAQESDKSEYKEFKHQRISLVIGHTHVPKGSPDAGTSGAVIVPSWGFDYEYWFNDKWGLGLHNDLELLTYVVDNNELGELKRERPVIVSMVGLFNPIYNLVVYIGPGIELEKHESFFVYRVGLEYEFEINESWELSPGVFYDNKEGLFDTWSIGLSVAKKF